MELFRKLIRIKYISVIMIVIESLLRIIVLRDIGFIYLFIGYFSWEEVIN